MEGNKPTRFRPSYNGTEKRTEGQFSKQRIEFTYGRIEKFIEDRGIDCLYEESILCTCRNPKTNAPDPVCEHCHGKGVAYLKSGIERVIIQSQDRDIVSADLGLYSTGSAIGTTMPNSIITFRDRLTLPEVAIGQSMIFDVTPKRQRDGFWIPFDIIEVTKAFGSDNRVLRENFDFTVDYERNLVKPSEELIGQNMSMNFNAKLRYIVTDLLKESRYQYSKVGNFDEGFDSLPKKILLRREDAWIDHSPFSGITESNDTSFNDKELKRDIEGGFFGGMI